MESYFFRPFHLRIKLFSGSYETCIYLRCFHSESLDLVPWHTSCWFYLRYYFQCFLKTFCDWPSNWCSSVVFRPSEASYKLFFCILTETKKDKINQIYNFVFLLVLFCFSLTTPSYFHISNFLFSSNLLRMILRYCKIRFQATLIPLFKTKIFEILV